jgi:hypothetical protein
VRNCDAAVVFRGRRERPVVTSRLAVSQLGLERRTRLWLLPYRNQIWNESRSCEADLWVAKLRGVLVVCSATLVLLCFASRALKEHVRLISMLSCPPSSHVVFVESVVAHDCASATVNLPGELDGRMENMDLDASGVETVIYFAHMAARHPRLV